MRLLVCGINGHMGRAVVELAKKGCRGAEVTAGVDQFVDPASQIPCSPDFSTASADVDCIVDFSNHELTKDLLNFAVKNNLPLVIATTGQSEEERELIKKAAYRIPLFFSANMSLGIAILIELAKKVASAMPDAEIEIIEKHHDRKLDAPSGTALAIAKAIQTVRDNAEINLGRSGHAKRTPTEIGIHAVRMGNIVGEHEVMIGTNNQTITLKHEAHDRALFAEGAIAAAEFIIGKEPGLYEMKDIVAF
jgi:4-hydroxy-tetrahydrodipicolinate reductase